MADPGLLQDKEFVRYLVSRGLSGFGSMATYIALPVLVYRTSDDPGLTALVVALEATPYLLFGLLSGALTDRWNRQRVMVAADLLSAALLLTIPAAAALDALTLPHVMAVAFLGPTIGVFFDGAVFGAIPMLVGRSRIAEANSYAWSLQSAIEIVAPAAVGALLAVVAPAWLLGFDSVTFLVSAMLLARIGRPMWDAARPRDPLSVRVVVRDVREGLAFLLRHEGVRSMTVIGTLMMISTGGYMALTVVWLDRVLGLGTEGWRFGITYVAWAIGGLAASLSIPHLVRFVRPARITLVAVPISAAVGVVTSRVTLWWLAALLYLVWAAALTLVVVNSISYRQAVTPEHLQGRVNTAGRMLSWGVGWTGGAALSGVVVGAIGVRPTGLAFAGIACLAAVFAWASPLRRIAVEPSTSVRVGA
ncbi:MFS transporter [Nocardioides bigeumensis]|uniref:MFS transporter n=1 Tax=Nocardioides bigeumensis TaxID=433657 RepID=A0ABN2XR07_9ACTN